MVMVVFLKCSLASRYHYLLKTFWGGPNGWRDRQLPDGTVTRARHTLKWGPPLRRGNGREAPFAGHALEVVNTTLLELQS